MMMYSPYSTIATRMAFRMKMEEIRRERISKRMIKIEKANADAAIGLGSLQEGLQQSVRRHQKRQTESTEDEFGHGSFVIDGGDDDDYDYDGDNYSAVSPMEEDETFAKIQELLVDCKRVIDEGYKLLDEIKY